MPVAQPQSARYRVTVCSPPIGGVSVHWSEVSLTPLRLVHVVSPTFTTGAPPKPLPPRAMVQLLPPALLEVHTAEARVGVEAALYA